MANPIDLIRSVVSAPQIEPSRPADGASGGGFSAVFSEAIQNVNQAQQSAAQTTDKFLSGEGVELHQVALATQRAELSFELFQQVRNKMVVAYQEVMRMQL